MKKIIISLLTAFLFVNATYGLEGNRVCETKYSTISGINYFSGIHCTEDIKLTGVVPDMPPLRDMSARTINDFIISNNYKIVSHLEGSGSCDDINTLSEISGFENVIYSNNSISYTSTTSSIESLTTSIETSIEDYNDEGLYSTVFDEMKSKYPLSSIDSIRNFTRDAYFDRQLNIKNTILDQQKEKLTLLYKITESQKFIEGFYDQVDKVCRGYEKEDTNEEEVEEETADEKEELIEKYKEEFNVKLGTKLDSLPRQVLESLSVKLLSYAETSSVFKRFSDAQREIVKLKITALKAVIDDRLE